MLRRVLFLSLIFWQKISGVSDRALTLLLNIVIAFLGLVAFQLDVRVLKTLVGKLSSSLYAIRKYLNLDRDDFDRFAVCPKCHHIYNIASCTANNIRKCTFRKWPNHPQMRLRRTCGKNLYIRDSWVPKRVYCFRSVSSYLREFVKQKDYVKHCNLWRNRSVRPQTYADIFDGEVWKDNENGFLQNHKNFYGMLNVDWFQPYKHSPYSLGCIYMVNLNLPRSLRFKDRYVMLLGVIPGPSEPKLTINSYLKPLIADLNRLKDGMHMQDGSVYGNIYKFKLLFCSSDLPATRKLGGFLSYHAEHGWWILLILYRQMMCWLEVQLLLHSTIDHVENFTIPTTWDGAWCSALIFLHNYKMLANGFMVRMSSSACAGAKLSLLICFEIVLVFGVGGL